MFLVSKMNFIVRAHGRLNELAVVRTPRERMRSGTERKRVQWRRLWASAAVRQALWERATGARGVDELSDKGLGPGDPGGFGLHINDSIMQPLIKDAANYTFPLMFM